MAIEPGRDSRGCIEGKTERFGRHTTEDCGIHRLRQHRDRGQEHAGRAVRHRGRPRGAQGTRRRRFEDCLRRLDARGRLQPVAHAARDEAGPAQPHTGRRQERRRHQPRARRARDGLHPRPHQRLRHRRRRQRLHHARREAQTVRQADLRRRRPRVHQHGDAAQLPRVHRLREPGGLAALARGSRTVERAGLDRRRSNRSCRSCGARSRCSAIARCRRSSGSSRARCCSSTRRSPSGRTAPAASAISRRSWRRPAT